MPSCSAYNAHLDKKILVLQTWLLCSHPWPNNMNEQCTNNSAIMHWNQFFYNYLFRFWETWSQTRVSPFFNSHRIIFCGPSNLKITLLKLRSCMFRALWNNILWMVRIKQLVHYLPTQASTAVLTVNTTNEKQDCGRYKCQFFQRDSFVYLGKEISRIDMNASLTLLMEKRRKGGQNSSGLF